ncbi:Ger(x)C family spore germination protein [Paenibacillus sp. YAF4_2]|uniref:Ger(x)C family spore germination protein n=1 Tax=Paenibacillus sp. YAF4_2 TaxID=3233085 RepID=UPI003F9EB236
MKQRTLAVLLLLPLLLAITGCWNRRELNDLAIAVGLGFDKVGDQYLVSVQVVDPGEVASNKTSGARTPVTLYQAKGQTIFEAMRKITTCHPGKFIIPIFVFLSFKKIWQERE